VVPQAPRVAQNEMLHKTKVDPNPILGGVRFIEKTQNPKFLSRPWAAIPSDLVILGLGQKIKILLPTFFLPRPQDSKKV